MRKIKDVQKNIMLYVLNTVAKINTYNWDDVRFGCLAYGIAPEVVAE